MSQPFLPDDLRAVIEALLAPEPRKPKGGRPRVPDRTALTGILFVLRSGTAWEMLPQKMGCGCGMPCRRRSRNWRQAGVWDRLQPAPRPVRQEQRHRLQAGCPRQRLCGGQKGGSATGPNPTDRGKAGTNRHILTGARGIPLALMLTGANVHDSVVLEEVVDAVPPVRQSWGPQTQARQAPRRQGL